MPLDHYLTLGRSGLRVSPLCLGAMTFGPDWGWGSDRETSRAIFDAYADAVRYVQETYYLPDGVTRHSTNAFMRLKLARELAKRELDPTVYEKVGDS